MNYQLNNALIESCKFYSLFEEYNKKIRGVRYCKRYYEEKKEIESKKEDYKRYIKGILCVSGFLFMPYILLSGSAPYPSKASDIMSTIGVIYFVLMVSLIIIFLLLISKVNKKILLYKKEIEEPGRLGDEENAKKIEIELENFVRENFNKYSGYIPRNYCDFASVYSLYTIINNGRADSLKEAINILEYERQWNRIENIQREIANAQIEYHNQMLEEMQNSNKVMNNHLQEIQRVLEYNNYLKWLEKTNN